MSTEIFYPMYYMLLLSLAVFLFTTLIRMKEIYIDKTSPGEDFRHALFPDGSTILKNAQKNHTNLFEYPVYFCAICIIIFVMSIAHISKSFVKLFFFFIIFF